MAKSMVSRAIKAPKHKQHCIGFVVGIYYKTDGQEWLANKKGQLVRLYGAEDCHIYHDEAKAKAAAEELAKTHANLGNAFYRSYFYGTSQPVSKWPKGMKKIRLRSDFPGYVIIGEGV